MTQSRIWIIFSIEGRALYVAVAFGQILGHYTEIASIIQMQRRRAQQGSINQVIILPGIGIEEYSELSSLLQTATPSQMKVITAMLCGALKAL